MSNYSAKKVKKAEKKLDRVFMINLESRSCPAIYRISLIKQPWWPAGGIII